VEIRVSATRMELLKLKRKLALAQRGHKLLKDKLDGLIQNFIRTSKELRSTYNDLTEELIISLSHGILLAKEVDRQSLTAALASPSLDPKVERTTKNLMGVRTPKLNLTIGDDWQSFGSTFFSEKFLKTVEKYKELLPKMLLMAEKYKTLQKVGREIVEIKRRVNALEYILIPSLEDKVRYIKMKLGEIERSTTVTLLKIKELVQR